MEIKRVLQDLATEDLDSFTGRSFYEELCSRGVDTSSFFKYMWTPARNIDDGKLKNQFINIAVKLRFHERHMHLPAYRRAEKQGLIVPANKSEGLFAYLENFGSDRGYAETDDFEIELDDVEEDEAMEDIKEETLEDATEDIFESVIEPTIIPKKTKKRGRKLGKCNFNPVITQIGSLPYDSVEKAVEYSLQHDIPFLPELPKLGDLMFDYIQNPGVLSCLDEFARHEFKKVKIQCVGPATLVQEGYGEDKDLWRPEGHVHKILNKIHAEEIILFVDEPSLGNASPKYKEWLHELFITYDIFVSLYKNETKLVKGVHTCNIMNWTELFLNEDIDMISFDASKYSKGFTSFQGYRRFRRRKGKIAWGIKKLEDIKDFRRGDLITLPCGLGGMNLETGKAYTEDDCDNYLKMMREARLKLQNGTCKNK